MQFRLVYRGRLKSGQSKDREHVHDIRRVFHSQLKKLWGQMPLVEFRTWTTRAPTFTQTESGEYGLLNKVGVVEFVPLVSSGNELLAELDILFLRPALPGALLRDGGDIDNRIKTLIDGLRMPKEAEIPANWQSSADERPFYCLLQDDKLVTSFAVTTDRLLDYADNEQDALIIVHVRLTAVRVTMDNSSLIG